MRGTRLEVPVSLRAPDKAREAFVCTLLCVCDTADVTDAAPCLVRTPAVVGDL